MKKLLLAGTALAAGLFVTGAATASEKIKLELGGYSKWWVVGAWQDDSYEAANSTVAGNGLGSANSVDVKGDNEIHIGGETTLDNGLTVGITVELEAGGNTDTNGGAVDVIDKSNVFVEGGFGKVILGSEGNGAALLHVMAPDAAANTGTDGLLLGGWAIARPAAISGNVTTELDTDGDAEKLTYVTPTFYGLTLGASYVPNTTEDNRSSWGNGTAANVAGTNNVANEIYGVGALYANTFGPVDVKVSAGILTYDTSETTDRSQEWSAGTQIGVAGFTVGGSYRNIKNNMGSAPVAGGAGGNATTDGYTWDAGIQYASGPYAVSFVYLNAVADGAATAGEDEITAYQVSGKYELGAGVDVLATVGHIEFDDETAKTANADANHNEGWAVMTGLSLAF